MELLDRRCWIFDLDGTLTLVTHDFAALRRRLGLPPGAEILASVDAAEPGRAEEMRAEVEAWEWAAVEGTRVAPDALTLLEALGDRPMGVLTRNTRPIALHVLEMTGLARWFPAELVLAREDAPPKPSPAGIERLLADWDAAPDEAVMVGDYVYDLEAGRAAGTVTVHVDRHGGPRWPGVTDRVVRRLDELL